MHDILKNTIIDLKKREISKDLSCPLKTIPKLKTPQQEEEKRDIVFQITILDCVIGRIPRRSIYFHPLLILQAIPFQPAAATGEKDVHHSLYIT